MTFGRQHLGQFGEDLAVEFLKKKGYAILSRNLKTTFGEIDILTRLKGIVVLVEVKTKRDRGFGLPQEMVHHHKQKKLRQLARWLTQQYPASTIRVDVIAVDLFTDTPQIEHLENVLEDN
jgi:putative endonuclease